MKRNLSVTALNPSGLSVRGVVSPQANKKVQGFDKVNIGDSFSSKVQKIKNRPKKETLEDMYVKGLQDEIHYLEMELKLLKEKELAKNSQVDQLETFFGDGIPINENILAMKNGFNNYKATITKKIEQLEAEKRQREGVLKSIGAKVSELSVEIKQNEKKYKESLTQRSDVTHQKVKEQTLVKQQILNESENLRVLKGENRKLLEQLSAMQRSKEIVSFAMLKAEGTKLTKLAKIKQSIAQKEKQFDDLSKNYQELKKQQDEKTYVIKVQEDNLKLKKKIISLEKQLNSLKIKAEEKKLELEDRLKQRHKEILARMDMQMRVDATKQAIDRQNSMRVQDLERIAKQKESKILEGIIDKNKKIAKYVDYYGSLLSKVEDNLYQCGQKKPDLKRQLQMQSNQLKNLEKQFEAEKKREYQLVSEIEKLNSKVQHINQIVPPSIEAIKKQQQRMKIVKTERERLIQQIKVKEKQLELIEILKSLNLEETQISSSSNSSIQDRLIDFMRNWQNLNRN